MIELDDHIKLSLNEANELLRWFLFDVKGKPNPVQREMSIYIYQELKRQGFPVTREDEVKKMLKI